MRQLKLIIFAILLTLVLIGCTEQTGNEDSPSILGIKDITYTIGDDEPNYLDGVTASDQQDGDLTADISVDDSAVDYDTKGTYTVSYQVIDSDGHHVTKNIDVIVIAPIDDVDPVISGTRDITYTIGDSIPNYLNGVTASDQQDGDLTADISVDDSAVDYDTEGTYTVSYQVIDSDGHHDTKNIDVIVMAPIDDVDPVISGTRDITYTIGDSIPNYLNGVTASDQQDGDLTTLITVDDSLVDYNVQGVYSVTYRVSDAAENVATIIINVYVEAVSLTADFDLYYLNDFHGSILESEDQMGFARIANLIMTKKDENPNRTLFISGGDILQGALLSNYYQGASTIEMLNMMGLDAFVIGNHEFDWGLDVLLQYFDQTSDASVHANFPLLGANVIEKASGERPAGIDAYTVIEKQGYKIGVIGTIGYGLESSIAASRVADYEFQDPVEWTEHYATYLRTIEAVDMVIAVNHGDSDYYNNSVADFTGDARVDAIFNGHSHQNVLSQVYRDGMDTFIMQSASNGRYVGYAQFNFTAGILSGFQANNLNGYNEPLLNGSQASMHALINTYTEEVADLIETNIITAGDYISRSDLTYFMAKIMNVKTNSDISFHNYGGTRTDVSNGAPMTVALAYEIFPFDNVVITIDLLGSTIKDLMSYTDLGYYTERSSFNDNTYYKVAVNDYVYGSYPSTFGSGQNEVDTGLMLRDLFIEVLEDLRDEGYETFVPSLDVPEPLSIDIDHILLTRKRSYTRDIINA